MPAVLRALLLSVAATLVLAPQASAERLPGSNHGGLRLTAAMTGDQEVPGPGDPDGSGLATITLNKGQNEVCWLLEVEDIEPATAAHIHRGPAGVAGPIVVPLSPPTDGTSSGCAVLEDGSTLIDEIRSNPEAFYVNVHNEPHPAGAIRGQLTKK